jgi:hypothetical protein
MITTKTNTLTIGTDINKAKLDDDEQRDSISRRLYGPKLIFIFDQYI